MASIGDRHQWPPNGPHGGHGLRGRNISGATEAQSVTNTIEHKPLNGEGREERQESRDASASGGDVSVRLLAGFAILQ